MKRPSFETLDITDLEEIADESGARRMPTPPRGLWSDAPPPPAGPSPASALDLGDLATGEPAASERLDFDDLVEGLSSRPAPKPESAEWDLSVPALRPPPPVPVSAPPRRPMMWPLVVAGVALAAYALGVGTIWLLEPSEVEVAAHEEPLVVAPVVIESAAPSLEAEPEASAPSADVPPVVEVPRVVSREELAPPRARRVAPQARAAQPAVERAADEAAAVERAAVERGAVERAAVEPAAVERAAVEEAAVEAADPAPSDLPESPAREDVLSAMASAQPAIEACATPADRGQLARVRFRFASDGRTAHTSVQGVSGASASCIATAARRVRVPAFSRDRFVIEFPFQL